MLRVEEFHDLLAAHGVSFFTGVPDSQLGPFCDYITERYGAGRQHIQAANEGNAAAIAAGYHLATGAVPLVYMQNSGLGNAVNPLTSLLDPQVYGIPAVLLVGWRGRPGVHDEPQHVKMGQITPALLDVMGVEHFVLEAGTTAEQVAAVLSERFAPQLAQGRAVTFVAAKGAFAPHSSPCAPRALPMSREQAVGMLAAALGQQDFLVSTTGKTSRELYEYRVNHGQGGERDFLTVGSMGHASSIALALAENRPEMRFWCLDGDGALLMHTGAMALVGSRKPANFMHVLLNNAAHESVGGMPTVADDVDWLAVASACGYVSARRVADADALASALEALNAEPGPAFLQIDVNLDCRADLGRPKSTPQENKRAFMEALRE